LDHRVERRWLDRDRRNVRDRGDILKGDILRRILRKIQWQVLR
jgi:hypothetical protein